MNAAFELLNHPFVCRIGWALLHSLWQGAVAALLFALLRSCLRHRSAQARYVAACCAFFVILVAPLLTSISTWTSEAARPMDWRVGLHGAMGGAMSFTLPERGGGVAWAVQISNHLQQALPWMVLLWAIGVVGSACRWIEGSLWVRKIKRGGTSEPDLSLISKLEELRARLKVCRPVRLLKSTIVEVPIVVGWLRPVILVPAGILSGLTPNELEVILAHELAHVRRLDYLVNLFQHLGEALMFYHPAVWWLSRCIREEREHCCDDLVIQHCGNRLAYARALVSLEELRGLPRMAFAANGGSLLGRIRRLLASPVAARPLGPREFAGVTLAALGCLLLVFGALLVFRPSLFQAAAIIRVQSDNTSSAEPLFLQTELALIRSPVVLRSVVQGLSQPAADGQGARDLPQGTQPTLQGLESRLDVRSQGSTSLLKVLFSDPSPIEAARIANEVAKAYQNYRSGRREKETQRKLRGAELRVEELDRTLHEGEQKADQLRTELRIPDSQNAPGELTAETLRHIESMRIELQANLVRDETLLKELKQLTGNDLYTAIQTVSASDPLMTSLAEGLIAAEQKLVELKKEFGPDHIQVVKAVARAEDCQKRLRERANGFLLGLDARVASQKTSLESLHDAVERAKAQDVELASRGRPYWDAKRKLDDLKGLRQLLVQKLATEQIDSELSRTPPVEIIEPAVAPMRPSTNRTPGAACIAAGLLLSLLGAWLARSANA